MDRRWQTSANTQLKGPHNIATSALHALQNAAQLGLLDASSSKDTVKVVSALLQLLQAPKNHALGAMALATLKQLALCSPKLAPAHVEGTPGALALLVAQLEPQASVCGDAAAILSSISANRAAAAALAQVPRAVEALVFCLARTGADGAATCAATALGSIASTGAAAAERVSREPGAVRNLELLLQSSDPDEVSQAACLVAQLLAHQDMDHAALSLITTPAVLRGLVRALRLQGGRHDTAPKWAAGALEAAAQRGHLALGLASVDRAQQALLETLKDPDPEVASSAAGTLAAVARASPTAARNLVLIGAVRKLVSLLRRPEPCSAKPKALAVLTSLTALPCNEDLAPRVAAEEGLLAALAGALRKGRGRVPSAVCGALLSLLQHGRPVVARGMAACGPLVEALAHGLRTFDLGEPFYSAAGVLLAISKGSPQAAKSLASHPDLSIELFDRRLRRCRLACDVAPATLACAALADLSGTFRQLKPGTMPHKTKAAAAGAFTQLASQPRDTDATAKAPCRPAPGAPAAGAAQPRAHERICAGCCKRGSGTKEMSLCAGCKRIWLCNGMCQRLAWKAGHKAQCEAWRREPRRA